MSKYCETWVEQAACRETDPDAFFPDKGGSSKKATTVCRACPVQSKCLDTAMRAEVGLSRTSRDGIWGGMVPAARVEYEPQWLAEQEVTAA